MNTRHDPSWLKNYDSPFSYTLKLILHRLIKFIHESDRSAQNVLVTHAHIVGEPVWSGIIKAYRTIWAPGNDSLLWGCVVYCTDAASETAYELLPSVLAKIQHSLTLPDDELQDDQREFVEHVRNNHVTLSEITVPASISPDVNCVVLDCLLARNCLPDGFLKHGPLPVLVMRVGQPQNVYAVTLHQRHWHEAFVGEWRRGFGDAPGREVANLAAIQILGLPPGLIDKLEQEVLAMCAREGLTATFLNVGFTGTPNRDSDTEMIPTSDKAGNLVFLGPVDETTLVQKHLQLLLNAHLSPKQQGYASIESMPMNDFVAAYGWLLRELSDEA